CIVQHWYRLWKELKYGDDSDPLTKLEEKKMHYNKLGVYLDITTWPANPSLWAAIIVTPLMDRIQDSS
ncbi:Ubiquitin carboxyl-terminal hydrolase 33, partial [Frankliniella fusca]